MEHNWWKEAVIYQIYPKSFYDSNHDGIGDLKGIMEKLPYLKNLGITAVWICPFNKSPMKDNGYDIEDYYSIEPQFGTMEDMDNLVKKADEFGIKIIMDMVLNHTSDKHAWFQKACADKNSPYRDYYIFKDNIENLSKLRSNFGGSTWTQIEDGSYYFHSFAKEQPDLNWESKELRNEIYKMINWWLDKGIAGFRMDAITYIKKNTEFPILEPDGIDGLTDVNKCCLNQEGIDELLQDLKNNTYGKYDAVTVAEAPGVPAKDLEAYIGSNGHFSMIFDFSYSDLDVLPAQGWYKESGWTFGDLKEKLFDNQRNVQKTGWAANYLENHDHPRSIDKYFAGRNIEKHHEKMASVLGTLFFFLRGTPFIYQGEELGVINEQFESIEEINDINSIDQYNRCLAEGGTVEEALKAVNRRSRDQSRMPMQWDGSEYAGFSDTTPWLGCNRRGKDINVLSQLNNANSVLNYYKKMIKLRNSSEYSDILIYGDFEEVKIENEYIFWYKRTYNNKTINITVNMAEEAISIESFKANILLNNYGDLGLCNINMLKEYEAIVWEEE